MAGFYRVTAVRVTNPKGFLKFNLQLNGSSWVSKLAPLKDYEKRVDKIYQAFVANGGSLKSLEGKYVYIGLQSGEYGENISFVGSCDMVGDFKGLLDKCCGEAFYTGMPIYDLLKAKGYAVSPDGSITLRSPYSNFDIALGAFQSTICYRNDLGSGYVNRNNIKLIYDRFYRDFKDESGNPDREETVYLGHVAIRMSIVNYHRDKGGVESETDVDLVRLGEKLQPEHLIYLSGI